MHKKKIIILEYIYINLEEEEEKKWQIVRMVVLKAKSVKAFKIFDVFM